MWDNHEFSWQGWQSIQKAGEVRAARAEHQGRREPGLVREYLPARCKKAERTIARTLRSAAGEGCRDREVGRERPWRRAQQPRRNQQPDRLSRVPLRQAPRPHHHRPAQLPQRRSVRATPRSASLAATGVPRHVPRGGDRNPRWRPCLWRRQSAGRDQLRRCARRRTRSKDAPPQTILGATQKAWFKDQLRARRRPGRSGAIRRARSDMRADPQNLPAGMTKETWPAGGYAIGGRRRLRHRLSRARRNLRPCPRREDHRLRDRLRRPPQLLGWLRGLRAAAGQVRAGGPELRRRFAVERRSHGSERAQSSKDRSASAAVPRRSAGRRPSPTGRSTCC